MWHICGLDGGGNGGTAALHCSTPAIIGHGEARREARELRGDDATLLRLPRLGEVLRRALPACAVAWQ